MKRPRVIKSGSVKPKSFTAESISEYEKGKAYRDQTVAWVIATRGWYPCEVVDSWDGIIWPMNQFRSIRITAKGMEVGAAYQRLFELTVDKKLCESTFGDYSKYLYKTKFVFTTEEDNIIPQNAIKDMLAAIYACPDCGREVGGKEWRCEKGHKGYDGIGGLYSVKTDPPIPMAFGDPKKGPNDFGPRSVVRALKTGKVLEVNGIAMGCSLFRKDLFKRMKKPWFKTTDTQTQDLYFCKRAKKELGARFGVHCGVQVGHIDINSGEII